MFQMKLTEKQKENIRREVSAFTDEQAKKLLARYAKAAVNVYYEDKTCEIDHKLKGHRHHRVSFYAGGIGGGKRKFLAIGTIDYESNEVYKAMLKKLIAYVNGNYQFSNDFLKFGSFAELELKLTTMGL